MAQSIEGGVVVVNTLSTKNNGNYPLVMAESVALAEGKTVEQKIGELEYVIEGSMSLDDINDRLGTSLEAEDYDSLGGFIIGQLDRLAEEGDEVRTEDGIRLVVEKLDKNRVESVHVYLPEAKEGSEASEAARSDAGGKSIASDSKGAPSDPGISGDTGEPLPSLDQ